MNSTNVPSNKSNHAVACAQVVPTNKELNIPPKNAKWGIDYESFKEIAENGDIVLAQADNSILNEKDQLIEMKNGKAELIANMAEGANNRVEKAKAEREKLSGKTVENSQKVH